MIKNAVKSVLRPVIRSRVFPIDYYARVTARLWQEIQSGLTRPMIAVEDRPGWEFRSGSQNGEDGWLELIFREIGFENRSFVEFGFHSGEANALRLMLVEKMTGLFMDGDKDQPDIFNRTARRMGLNNVQAVSRFLTVANIEETISGAGISRDIDLLSIDIDGNDYWMWQAITNVRPRVVVIEYNATLGSDKAITIPYQADFDRLEKHSTAWYHGASLRALSQLGAQKGYRLIGCDATGVNAFFVREDIVVPSLPPLRVEDAFRPNQMRAESGLSIDEQFEMMADLPFEVV